MKTNIVPMARSAEPTYAEIASALQTARSGTLAKTQRLEAMAREIIAEARAMTSLAAVAPVGVVETARQMADQIEAHANRLKVMTER